MTNDEPTRVARNLTAVLSAANIAAAILGTLLAWLVVPGAQAPHAGGRLLVNGIALVAYLALAVTIAYWWARRRIVVPLGGSSGELALAEGRQIVLIPLHTSRLVAGQWLGALVLFSLLNVSYSMRFVVAVGATIVFTGLAMCAVAYLVTEAMLRPLLARVLAGSHVEDFTVGVARRQMLAWTLGTGSAVFGLLTIGVNELLRPRDDAHALGIAIVVFCTIALAGGLLVEYLASRAVSGPLGGLRAAFERVRGGDLEAEVGIDDATEVGRLQHGFNLMVDGLRERERLRSAFSQHVGEDVARYAMTSDGTRLGGQTREVCTLFVDLVESTRLAAERPGEEVIAILNRFFGLAVEAVEEHGGSINKFQGDAALAVFGAPDPAPESAANALAAARRLAARLSADLPELRFGIGVSRGQAVAGNVGAEQRLEYTVIGDPVNEAARLTELAKHVPGAVAASGEIVAAAPREEAVHWRHHEDQLLRGRSATTKIMTIGG